MTSTGVVLGINDSHDAGVAVLRDGELVYAVNEERLNRVKMANGFPTLSLRAALSEAGITASEVQHVGIAALTPGGGDIPANNDLTDKHGRHSWAQKAAEVVDSMPLGGYLMSTNGGAALYRAKLLSRSASRKRRAKEHLKEFGIDCAISTLDHHDAHLSSAYYLANAPDSLVISNDFFGDGICSKVAVGNPETYGLKVIATNSFYNSLGAYYNYVTLFCHSNKSHHAGKTTGLAAFGDPNKTLSIFQEFLSWDESVGMYRNHGGIFRNCIESLRTRLKGYSREDMAAGIQKHSEDILTKMVSHYMKKTNRRRIVLAGGVHANVKINQRIAELPGVEELFVFPNMGDGGLCVGAAYAAEATRLGRNPSPRTLKHVFLGSAFSDEQIAEALNRENISFTRPENIAHEVARLLAEQKIVARFDGAMEFGPRALGNRSILYPATDAGINKRLNEQLNRTEYMPFAPVLRERDANQFLKNCTPVNIHSAEYMTVTYDVTDRCKREAPAVVHVDGTARPQVLVRNFNPSYYDILEMYQQLTGLSVLVNTSFNMHEEPIVCTPTEAIRAYEESRLDALAIGPYLVRRLN
ncbi:MAG: hypothetical protein M0P95_04210 [Sulfuritalea sp.]|nr:hypothetical protein [Sulfuritalea sp.]